MSQNGAPHFGDQLYRKRYLVTVIADRTTDDGDDWGASIGDSLGSGHCLWDLEEVESVELTAPSSPQKRRTPPPSKDHSSTAGSSA